MVQMLQVPKILPMCRHSRIRKISNFVQQILSGHDITQTSVEFTDCWTEQPDTTVEGVVDKHGNLGNLYLKIINNNLKI